MPEGDFARAQGTWTSCDFHEGMSAASMYIEAQSLASHCEHSRILGILVGSPLCKVKRRSQYYVVSVLGVMLGISSLVFTARPPEYRGFFLVVLLLLLLMLLLRIQISLIRMP